MHGQWQYMGMLESDQYENLVQVGNHIALTYDDERDQLGTRRFAIRTMRLGPTDVELIQEINNNLVEAWDKLLLDTFWEDGGSAIRKRSAVDTPFLDRKERDRSTLHAAL